MSTITINIECTVRTVRTVRTVLLTSFKVVALLLQAMPPSPGPRVQDAMSVLQGCDGAYLVCNRVLQGIQGRVSDSFDVLLQSAVQPKITWSQVRRVCRVGQAYPSKLPDKVDCEIGIVGGCIVQMYKFSSSHTGVGSVPGMSCIKPPEDCSEDLLIDSLWPLDKFVVNESSTIKEGENHDLGCCDCPSRHLGARLTFS